VVRESAGGALILIKLGDVLRILARRTVAFCSRKPTVPPSLAPFDDQGQLVDQVTISQVTPTTIA
jgi:hypothetical protein